MANVGALTVDFRANSAAFVSDVAKVRAATEQTSRGIQTAMAGASRAFSMLGAAAGALGVGLSLDALVGFAQRTIIAAGAISELADQLGVTTDQLQLYRFAALQSGTSSEVLEQAMIRFADTMGSANNHNDAAIASFQRLGVTLLNSRGQQRDMNAVWTDTITRLMQIPDVANRVSAGSDLMGRNFARLQPTLTALTSGLDATRAEAERTGQIMDRELIQRADALADRWAAASGGIGRTMLPMLVAIAEALDRIGRGIATIDWSRVALGMGLPGSAARVGALAEVDRTAREMERLRLRGEQLRTAFARDTGTSTPGERSVLQAQFDRENAALTTQLNLLQNRHELARAAAGMTPTSQAAIPPVPPMPPGTGRNPVGTQAGRDAAREAERAADAYRRLTSSLDPLLAAENERTEGLRVLNEMQRLNPISAEEMANGIRLITERYDEARAAQTGFDSITQQTRSHVVELSDRFGDLGDSIAQSIEGAITKFTSLNDLLGNILQNIGKVLIQAAITDPLKAAVPRLLGSLVSAFYGGNQSSAVTGPYGSFSAFGNVIGPHGPIPLQRFAGGGVVNSPHLAMFGEGSGPEAFIPLRDGGIPVHIRGDGGRQRGGDVYLSIDARGAEPGAAIRIEAVAQRAALKMRDAMYDDMERGGRLARASGRRRK